MSTIPASANVRGTPSVLTAGGTALSLNGIILTESTRVPIGQVLSLANDGVSVGAYFGASATEVTVADVYFAAFNTSTIKPASIQFVQYPLAPVAAYLRGGNLSSMTLAALTALSGTLTISVDGTPITSSTITLTAATSFSDAATIIGAAFTTPGFTVTYDSVSSAFLFTNTATGAASTIGYATGTLAAEIYLTAATGATLSQGADAAVPGAFMTALTQLTQNWVSFMHMFDPDQGSGNTIKQEFMTWANAQNNRYAYVPRDTDITPTSSTTATTSLGYIAKTTPYSGTVPVYDPGVDNLDAFVCGSIAAINTAAKNGRITLAFRGQDGLVASVTDETTANNLIANGYNFYGAYATAAQQFIEFQPGQISGSFAWIDSFINQVWITNALQLAWMELLQAMNSIPYNAAGYSLIKQAAADPIAQALNWGAIATGVTLSSIQRANINNAGGSADAVQRQGWYLLIGDATPQTRAARGTPPVTFWYTGGGSVQKIDFASILVQ
jgi:hypothetical protein